MRKIEVITLIIILLFFVIGIYFYPQMPERVASHWNIKGQVDGYSPKSWGLFLMPIISVVLFLLFILIPKIDPLKENIKKFRRYFDWLILLIIIFIFYLYLLTISWNIGFRFDFNAFLIPALGLLLYYAGIVMENAKRNWFIGIRTPWTLSNEKVWDKTHKIGGKLFKMTGLFVFSGILFPAHVICLVFTPIVLVSLYLVIYSYFEYQKESKKADK